MNYLKLNICFGISVILKYKVLFSKLLKEKKVDQIHVSLCLETLKKYRNSYSEAYTSNMIKIMEYFFSDSKIQVIQSKEFPTLTIEDLSTRYNISVTYSILPEIRSLSPFFPFKYITISTKVLNTISFEDYIILKPYIFEILSALTLPIVILGEQTVTPCHEYEIHPTFSIYNDLKSLPNIIDKTIPSTEDTTRLESLLETLSILHHSKLNIFISCGGISAITFFSSKYYIGLTQDYYTEDMFQYTEQNTSITSDYGIFLEDLNIMIFNLNNE